MTQAMETSVRVEHFGECKALLESLLQPGAASLVLDAQPGQPHPVVVMQLEPGERISLDVTAVPELLGPISRGETFSLCGEVDGAMLQSQPIAMLERLEESGRLQFVCAYPQWVDLVHRRQAFRVDLRQDMVVDVLLRPKADGEPLTGRLVNLSLGGCLVELASRQAVELQPMQVLDGLLLRFPGGQELPLVAQVRHMHSLPGWQTIRLGCAFVNVDAGQERRLWFAVREIERERKAEGHGGKPSALFTPREAAAPAQVAASNSAPPSLVTRRLAKLAGYLDTQLIKLRLGEAVDPIQLSLYSDLLLLLLGEDRDSLLFETLHLVDEPPLVQHSIAVAVRLVDIASKRGLPRELLKSVVGSALVHDLGKTLLPAELRDAVRLDAAQRQAFAGHVALLGERLEDCRWLAKPVREAVVDKINERLDGSGYPLRAGGEQLSELARMAAVADAVDAMARPRADRPAFQLEEVYRHLLSSGDKFDVEWCKRYIRHFGTAPVGSLVRFTTGRMGWVRRVDDEGRLDEVQLTERPQLGVALRGERVGGVSLSSLGSVERVLVPEL